MPERVTRQEKIISLAIEKARKAKEELSEKKRKNIEPTQVLEIDTDPEVEKIKRPKVQDASKITNQTQKKEGYGLAGESFKKMRMNFSNDNAKNMYHQFTTNLKDGKALSMFNKIIYARGDKGLINEQNIEQAKQATLAKFPQQPTQQPRPQKTPEETKKIVQRFKQKHNIGNQMNR